jgi:hypothetical protein
METGPIQDISSSKSIPTIECQAQEIASFRLKIEQEAEVLRLPGDITNAKIKPI